MIFLTSTGENIFQLIFVLFVFVGIIAMTYFVTRWIAGYQKTQGRNRNLEIVEAIRVTNNRYVQIIRAGEDRYFVIAVGKDEINLLGELSSSELKELGEQQNELSAPVDFKAVMNKMLKKEK